MKLTQVLFEWVLTSVFLILAVLVLRALLGKRVSAGLRYALWLAVLVRLLVPVQLFTTPVTGTSVMRETGAEQFVVPPTEPAAPDPVLSYDLPDPAELPDGTTISYQPVPAPAAEKTEPVPILQALGWLWLAGSLTMAAAFLVSNVSFARRLRRVRELLEGVGCPLPVYIAEGLPSPCLWGLAAPGVYLAAETAQDPVMLRHILAHEYTHCLHGDHIWNILRSAALTVHWWNPLVWLAVILSRRDCELACDEGALKRLGDEERIAYGRTLLALILVKPRPADLLRCSTTMTGAQKSVFDRITRIAHAPKRWLWAAVAAVLATALACVCAFGQAAADLEPEDPSPESSAATSAVPVETVPPLAASAEPTAFSGNFDFEFYLVGKDAPVRFSELTKAIAGTIEFTFRVEQYTILDLDQDGSTELILELEGQGGFLILRLTENGLYGYSKARRGLGELKADGTFRGSSGAGDWGYYRIEEFGSGYGKDSAITWCESVWNEKSTYASELYFVDGSPATRQEFEAASAAQDQKEPAPWQSWPYGTDAPEEVIQWLENAGTVWLEPVEKPVVTHVDGTEHLLTYHGKEMRFHGRVDSGHTGNVRLRLMDINGDGREEIAFSLIDDSGDTLTEQLYLFDAETLERYDTQDLGRVVGNYLSTSSDDTCFAIAAPEFDFYQAVPRGEAMEIEDKKSDTLEISTYVMFTAWEDKQLACVFSTPVGKVYGFLGLEGNRVVCTGFEYERYDRVGVRTSYADVLLWGVPFGYQINPNGWGSEQVSAKDIPSLFDSDDPYMAVWSFAVVDLNGDGYDEVVLHVCGVSGSTGGYLVLYQGGSVCGFTSGWRTFWDLKTDGTFMWSDPTGYVNGFAFYPVLDPAEMQELSRMTSSWGEPDAAFYLDGARATEAEYRAFSEQQQAKPDVVWHEYTQENIETLLNF